MKKLFAIISMLVIAVSAMAQEAREFCDKVFTGSNGAEVPYKVLYPENFKPEASYPLLLFLHGAGERGTDNELQLTHGGDLLKTSPELRNVIVIVPQCPEEDYWARIIEEKSGEDRVFPLKAPEAPTTTAVKELLDDMIALGFADADRIYGTGLSMGAMGLLDMVMRYPDFFAAVEPICGGVNVERCKTYRGRTAFRFFHGLKDAVVLPKFSIEANDALKQSGVETSIVTYPDATHGSWKNAFVEPDFLSWLFMH